MSPEFKSPPQLLQFTGEEIEEIDNYHGLKLSHKDLPTVLFSAKIKDGTGMEESDWQTFVKAFVQKMQWNEKRKVLKCLSMLLVLCSLFSLKI
ncbi:hypothetical protein GX50_03879 [[Emmonsia] crescens]|uniref:Uncharacterized protein n=1 Tax=[Emmonsia] crescens TaxID=73230 RepID=A0A2B7ZH72_9EURO|nr:hypothetical protein GX50_03879 [Emmonsia crescens]